jgi:deoxyribodipyrimidine photo-lyase
LTRALYWFRNDLRLQDNPAFTEAVLRSERLSFVFIHDPRLWHKTPAGIPRMGWHRRKFLKQSLDDLRQQLADFGFELLEIWGEPEFLIPELMEDNAIDVLYFSSECGPEERKIEISLKESLEICGREVVQRWSQFLLEPGLLPFPLHSISPVFTQFRKQIEGEGIDGLIPDEMQIGRNDVKARSLSLNWVHTFSLTGVQRILSLQKKDWEQTWWQPSEPELHLLNQLRIGSFPNDKSKIILGGTAAAERRIQEYFFETKAVLNYFETRNGLLSASDSTLFSSWLALGCVSARQIYRQLKKCQDAYGANKSTYWVVFELLWREFFKLHLLHSGEDFFDSHVDENMVLDGDVKAAIDGLKISDVLACRTGQNFIDANLRELILTGFMSNRGRQNVASYLIHTLGICWKKGASIFESLLIDYDVASNWGNWSYIAGARFDPRGGRRFNLEKQQCEYDPLGQYVVSWSEQN